MEPINESTTKSLFSHLCDQMSKLSKEEISPDQAKAQALLARQATSLLRYELDRAKAIAQYGGELEPRSIESPKKTLEIKPGVSQISQGGLKEFRVLYRDRDGEPGNIQNQSINARDEMDARGIFGTKNDTSRFPIISVKEKVA